MTKGIINIAKYNEIVLGKRYKDNTFWTLNFLRDGIGYRYFNGPSGQNYVGKLNIAETFKEIRDAYDCGYRTLNKK